MLRTNPYFHGPTQFFAYLMLFFQILGDFFRDHQAGGHLEGVSGFSC